MIATSKGGYKKILPSMTKILQPLWKEEEEAMEEDILPKFAAIVERQGISLIHAIKNIVFHLISSLKIRTMESY